jgi:hypothetical protein
LNYLKMVVFIDPNNERALATVKKWEFLTADEYGDEAFAEVRVQNAAASDEDSQARERERAISLADALTVRNDPDRALEVLQETHAKYGDDPELRLRLSRLKKRLQIEDEVPEPLTPKIINRPGDKTAQTIALLQSLLRRIEERSS